MDIDKLKSDAFSKTLSRKNALLALRDGRITHPGTGVASALEKVGAILWDRPANTYRITKVGEELLSQWTVSHANEEFAAVATDKVGSVRIVATRPIASKKMPSNQVVTKEGIEVKPGQVWQDLDKRMSNRKCTVLAVLDGKAHMGGVPKTKVSISRMHKSSTGWMLVQ